MLGDWIGSQLNALDTIKDDAIKQMGAMTGNAALSSELLTKVDDRCQAMLQSKLEDAAPVAGKPLEAHLAEPLQKSVKELDSLLGKGWRDKCGRAPHGTTDPLVTWRVSLTPWW